MKPEPIFPPAPTLSDDQRLILRVSAVPKGGPHPVKLRGASNFRTARSLARLGLGVVDDRTFTANARGAAAVREEKSA